MIGEILSGVEAVKNIKNQADYLKSLTEEVEKATEILQAKSIALNLIDKVEKMQKTIDDLSLQNVALRQKLETRASVKPVILEGEHAPIMLFEADFGSGIVSKICPVCWQKEEKTIPLLFERANMGSVGIGDYFSSTKHERYTCPCCQTQFLHKVITTHSN